MPGRCGNRKGTWQEIVRCCLPPATSVVRLFRAVQTKCFVLKLRHPADDYLKARSPVACRATLPTAAKRRQDARGGWAIATDLAVGPTLGRCRRWTLRALIGLGGWDGLRGDHGRHRKRRRGPWDRDAGPGPCGSPRPRRARPTCRPRCGGGLPDRPQRLRAEHSAGAGVAGRGRHHQDRGRAPPAVTPAVGKHDRRANQTTTDHAAALPPRFIRCDNDPELTANALRDWCRFTGAPVRAAPYPDFQFPRPPPRDYRFRIGSRGSPITSTCRTRTSWRSAPPTRCRSPVA